MSRFIRCDRCATENAVIGTVSLPPGWLNICGSDLCERCCETVRDFIRFRPSEAERLPVEPIPLEVGPTDAPPDKLFETSPVPKQESVIAQAMEKTVELVNSGALDTPGCTVTASISNPSAEASTEEKARTRKTRKRLMGQGAILPDPRKPQPGAPA